MSTSFVVLMLGLALIFGKVKIAKINKKSIK